MYVCTRTDEFPSSPVHLPTFILTQAIVPQAPSVTHSLSDSDSTFNTFPRLNFAPVLFSFPCIVSSLYSFSRNLHSSSSLSFTLLFSLLSDSRPPSPHFPLLLNSSPTLPTTLTHSLLPNKCFSSLGLLGHIGFSLHRLHLHKPFPV